MKHFYNILIATILIFCSCSKSNEVIDINQETELTTKNLTIFIVNDVHAQIDNFSKVKYIIDKERENTNVIVTSSGDIFSGNPIVDNYPQKGYPVIDLMNKVGFDIVVIGNHEYDYGETNLRDRMLQAEFDWVCANVNMDNSV
ncbi:MAG: metallophosphoesterase, partial [Flavobacteriaceae bacterium]|nr:metallophosphoesterase [Flavobacteriaceae bacterium]